MKCGIMQPTYMPWLGYFSMIDQVDKFVFLDDVQLTKRSWQIRNKIKNNDTELILSIPVQSGESRKEITIQNAQLDESSGWREKHLKSIKYSYVKAPYFTEVYSFLEEIFSKPYTKLSDFNIHFISEICLKIGISTELIKSSNIKTKYGKKDVMLATICTSIGANSYLSAQGSAAYIEKGTAGGEFVNHSIQLYYHVYDHPQYQQNGKVFIPHLGILDLLFNEGFEKSLDIIRSGNKENLFYKEYRNLVIEGKKNENRFI